MLHVAIVTVITALILAYAGLRGALPERWAAAMIATRYLIDFPYHWVWGETSFVTVDTGHALMDGMMLAGFVWLALVANRVWPVWAAAGALIAMLGHAMMLAGKDGVSPAYWATTNGPHFVQLIAVFLGTIFHSRRFRELGPYRDWS